MIIAQNKQGTTEYLPQRKIVVGTYHGKSNEQFAMEHIEKSIRFYQSDSSNVDAVIADVRGLYGSFAKLLDYLSGTFYPVLAKNNVKAQAIIVKDDVIVNHLSGRIARIGERLSIQSRIFYSIHDAENWIKEVLKK